MPALVRYPDRDAPGVMHTGYVVQRAENEDGEWCLCQPTHDGHGAAIRRGERYQQWVHVDAIVPFVAASSDPTRPRAGHW